MIEWLGKDNPKIPIFLTIPHSGEELPPEAAWLKSIPKDILLTDIDRHVDKLYANAIEATPVPALLSRVHRYVVDLNRYPDDVDQESVEGASELPGKHPKGFHWVITTKGSRLMENPISNALHKEIEAKYFNPFHDMVEKKFQELEKAYPNREIFHLDCHSMPSVGTLIHRDPGKTRAEIVISDLKGQSATQEFKDLVFAAFKIQEFEVSYNWPYFGGRITQRYGDPQKKRNTVQIEINRSLYMDENTKEVLDNFGSLQERIAKAIHHICAHLGV